MRSDTLTDLRASLDFTTMIKPLRQYNAENIYKNKRHKFLYYNPNKNVYYISLRQAAFSEGVTIHAMRRRYQNYKSKSWFFIEISKLSLPKLKLLNVNYEAPVALLEL